MKRYTKLQCFLTVFFLCFVNLGYNAQTLGLYEGDICRTGDGETSNHICRNWDNCPDPIGELKKNSYPICSFNGITPIICCPPEKKFQITTTMNKPASISPVLKTYSATEKCREYSELIYFKRKDPILIPFSEKNYITKIDCYDANPLISGGENAEPKEFPHMVLLGYGEKPDNESWFCGGSLISNRFVLTAAHCVNANVQNPSYVKWARLGELDYNSETADDRHIPTDYKIVERIIHPNYKSPSLYNDIALLHLERDVNFSAYVRPICLNTDDILTPPAVMATGWGKTASNRRVSTHLLKVRLNTISVEECNNSFFYMPSKTIKLAKGIDENSMLCTGKTENRKDTCRGDSGGPIQIKHNSYKCMYSQIGITSFGQMCGNKDSSAAHTRVSNYISWIEGIVWPKNE